MLHLLLIAVVYVKAHNETIRIQTPGKIILNIEYE
jgi:hypothetical protein